MQFAVGNPTKLKRGMKGLCMDNGRRNIPPGKKEDKTRFRRPRREAHTARLDEVQGTEGKVEVDRHF